MRTFFFELFEGLRIAGRAIWTNKLRSMLTTLGIIIGITSVTSMVTVLNGIERGFETSLSSLGTDVLYVEKWPWGGGPDFKWWEYINRPRITEDLAEAIRVRSRYAAAVAPVVNTGRPAEHRSERVRGVSVEGSTASYDEVFEVELAEGRFYNAVDDRTGRRVAVIGSTLAETLFPVEEPLNKTIKVGGLPFLVIGVLEKQGSGFGGPSEDNQVKIPYTAFKAAFGTSRRDVSVRVKVVSPELMAEAEDELTGILRAARGLDAREEDDFVINQQQAIREQLAPVKFAIFGIGIFLTALSLLVGGIGVMNIMFVSVKERTREIGIRKAVGATRRAILAQFLIEAVIICLIGGTIAVGLALVLTVLINQVFTAYLPASTILLAFGICAAVGIGFGLAPAWGAANAEPIDALRYE